MEFETPVDAVEDAAADLSAGGGETSPALVGDPGCSACAELTKQLRIAVAERGYWRKMHEKAVEREKDCKSEIERLKADVRKWKRMLFGRKSERKGKGKGDGAGDKPKPSKRKRGQQRGAPGHGRRLHSGLPVKEEDHSLPEELRTCPKCGGLYCETGETEDSEVVEVEVKAHRRRIRRRRYRRGCSCEGPPRTLTAPVPPKLFPKGAYGISFWVLVLIDKFLFHHPTARLLASLALMVGLSVSAGTVTGGLKRLAPLFEPLYKAIIAKNRDDTRWHADETRWMVFDKVEGKEGHRWYLWAFRSSSTLVFRLEPTRSSKVPQGHFGKSAKGILNVDRYVAYKTLLESGLILLAYCWAHVRRDFLGVAKDWPKLETWALDWVERIRELYRLNSARLAAIEKGEEVIEAQAKLSTAVEQMAVRRDAELADGKLHEACRKVLTSLKNHWSGLILFVSHPEVPMDNNQAERDLRGPVVGRKNYYGSGSVWSGRLMAMVMSVLQTVMMWGLDPKRWLTAYFEACANNGGAAPDNAACRLPWNLTDAERQELLLARRETTDTS